MGERLKIPFAEVILSRYNKFAIGDDRLRRRRLVPDCEPRGAEIVNSAQQLSANRTNLSTLPLAA